MSGFGLLSPLCLAASALAIPIILLYMLRLRRTEMPISSNFLWQQLVRDREANAPWQRLRPNLLLFLQLLILAALVLALARPFTEETTIITGRTVVLLDASASMNATDMDGNKSRFEAAKDLALDTVGNLRDGDTMTVIRVAEIPEVLVAASRDKTVLRNAIRDARPSNTTANWNAALALAAAGRVGVDDLNVVALTDGGLPTNLPLIPGAFSYVRIGESPENVGISQLSTDVLPGEAPELYYRVDNFGEEDTRVVLAVELDGDLYTAQRLEIPGGGFYDGTFEDLPDNFTRLTATVNPASNEDTPDYLPDDNTAHAIFNATGSGDVLLITERNIFLERIFEIMSTIELTTRTPEEGLPASNYGLYIFDSWLPNQLPEGDLLIVNPPESSTIFTVTGTTTDTQVDPDTGGVDRTDNRTRFFDFSSVDIRQIQVVENTDWATPLVATESGLPLVLAGEVNNRQVAIITFDLHESNLPLQISWPILVTSLMEWYQPQRVISLTNSIQPGTPVTLRPLEGASVRVIQPDGNKSEYGLEDSAVVNFGETDQLGLYEIEVLDEDGDVIQRDAFAVNLFSELESRIQPLDDLAIETDQGRRIFRESLGEETGRREWWRSLAILGLVVLAIEWWYYHRSKGRVRRAAARVSYETRQVEKKSPRWQFWARQ